MELSQQVTSLELSKRLKELGVKQVSLFYWYDTTSEGGVEVEPKYNNDVLGYHIEKYPQLYHSAFTVSELGEMLPKLIKNKYHLALGFLGGKGTSIPSETLWFVGYREIITQETENAHYGDYLQIDRHIAHTSGIREVDARAKMLIYLLEQKLIVL